MRIEIDDGEHAIAAGVGRLRVGDDLIVVGPMEAQRPIALQRAVAPADRVDAADELGDVAGPVPIPSPVLTLHGLGVLLRAGLQRAAFTEFESAVDAVRRAER